MKVKVLQKKELSINKEYEKKYISKRCEKKK